MKREILIELENYKIKTLSSIRTLHNTLHVPMKYLLDGLKYSDNNQGDHNQTTTTTHLGIPMCQHWAKALYVCYLFASGQQS